MIQQKRFYDSITRSEKVRTIAKFRQIGTMVAGYLPKGSAGACSFTTMDFHRAVSQGCLAEWCQEASTAARKLKNGFGARQQLNYLSPESRLKDPLFTRSLSKQAAAALTGDDVSPFEREKLGSALGVMNPNEVADIVRKELKKDPNLNLRLNFNVKNLPHVIGLCCSKQDSNKIIIMDPNAGVFEVDKSNLQIFLNKMQTVLYHDYKIEHPYLEKQVPFWIDLKSPPSEEAIQSYRLSEARLLTQTEEGLSHWISYEQYKKENPPLLKSSSTQPSIVEWNDDDDLRASSKEQTPRSEGEDETETIDEDEWVIVQYKERLATIVQRDSNNDDDDNNVSPS